MDYSLKINDDIHTFQLEIYDIDHFQILEKLSSPTKTFWEDIDFFGNAELSISLTKDSVTLHSSFDYHPQSELDEIIYIKRYNYSCPTLTRIHEIEHLNRIKLLVRPNDIVPYFRYLSLEDVQQLEKDVQQLILLQLEHIKTDYSLYLKDVHQEIIKALHD